MNKKRNTSSKQKNVVLLFAMMLVISLLFTACGSSAAETNSATIEEVAVDKSEEKITDEVAQGETVTEATVVESIEEVAGPQSAKEWAQSVDTTTPKMTIWNDILKEGIILEDGQKYVLRQDDTLLFCTKEKKSGISLDADIAGEDFEFRTTDKYVKIQLNNILTKETLFKVRVTVAGTEYPFSVTLISESAANSTTASEPTLSGKEWAATLEYEEPKLIAWNDETGTREVIDNGGSYKMQSGDVLGIYHGEKYVPSSTDPFEFCEGFNAGLTYSMMICNLPEESQTINLGLEFYDKEAEDFFTYYFMITTP